MAVFLSEAFKRMSRSETFVLADACGAARGALDKGESALCAQFVVLGYDASKTGIPVDEALSEWHRAYAVSKGASVSDKGRISTSGMSESAKADYLKVRNSFNVAKSAIVKAVALTDKIVPMITDGGSVLLDGNGIPRSKGELLKFIAEASKSEKSELEKAVSRLMAAYAAAGKLTDDERAIFDDTAKALAEGRMTATDEDAE